MTQLKRRSNLGIHLRSSVQKYNSFKFSYNARILKANLYKQWHFYGNIAIDMQTNCFSTLNEMKNVFIKVKLGLVSLLLNLISK